MELICWQTTAGLLDFWKQQNLRRYRRKLNGSKHCRTSGIISHCATM